MAKKVEKIQKNRNWCFTLSNYTDRHIEHIDALECRYVGYGKEIAPSTGTPHLQGFIVFDGPKTFNTVRKLLEGANIEVMKGSFDRNVKYCSKEGKYTGRGEPLTSQKEKGEKGKQWWLDQVQAVSRHEYLEVDTKTLIQNFSGLHRAAQVLFPISLEDTTETHLWYYGPSRTGKSRAARSEYPNSYKKMCNKWWDGYTNQEAVLIEDLGRNHDKLVDHLKIWADRYAFPAEFKGGKIDIRPRIIIVTSNYHPSDIWTSEQDLDPICKRFKIVRFGDPVVNSSELQLEPKPPNLYHPETKQLIKPLI